MVPRPSIHIALVLSCPAPDDHVAASPNCGVIVSRKRGICSACSCPSVGTRAVPASGIEIADNFPPAPDNHFRACPNCSMLGSGSRRVDRGSGFPRVRGRVVLSTRVVVDVVAEVISAPDNHVTTSPHCCVEMSSSGRIGNTGSYPCVCAGIVSSTRIELAVEAKRIATPHDHFGAGPNRCVEVSATGGDGSARSCPAICARSWAPVSSDPSCRGPLPPGQKIAANCCICL